MTTRKQWARLINEAWRSSVIGIIEAGRLLTKAKGDLEHGQFITMIENDLPFGRITAFRLMAVAADRRLTNVTHVQHLPPHWGTLYELTKLPDKEFTARIKDGSIHSEMQRKDVAKENRQIRKARDEDRVLNLVPVEGRCKTLMIDPPWDYEWLSIAGRASPGYATMTEEELLNFSIEQWVDPDHCHMYLWTTNNFMMRAGALMKAWGFDHKTVLTGIKPRLGLGSYFRNTTEHMLFGIRGDVGTRRDDIPTHFEFPMGEHSEKPEQAYDIVRAASYPPYGEIFQREPRPDFINLFKSRKREAAE